MSTETETSISRPERLILTGIFPEALNRNYPSYFSYRALPCSLTTFSYMRAHNSIRCETRFGSDVLRCRQICQIATVKHRKYRIAALHQHTG